MVGTGQGVAQALWKYFGCCRLPVVPEGAGAGQGVEPLPLFAAARGEVVLDNSRVHVQRMVLLPGMATGAPVHHGDVLEVFIRGGVLRSAATGRATLWKDGRVAWHGAPRRGDTGRVNAGTGPIELIWVWVKPVPESPATGVPKFAYLDYPGIPGEDLLENELVIVQRFLVAAGQWEGVHAHHPDMLYIHVRGGQWAARSYTEPERAYDEPARDGEVGWMPTIDITVGHESGNIGPEAIDLIWVTLKR